MKMMKNAIVAQSGGPTTAINASLAGVIKGCLESHEIDVLYGALNGVEGLMDERLVNLTDIFDHNEENLNVLKLTPAMSIRIQVNMTLLSIFSANIIFIISSI